jgi:Flp pilus assembly protein TadG
MNMKLKSERGTAIVETAMVLPLLLLVSIGIFEFGRAYQTWQVLTNAAREGARIAVLPNYAAGTSETRVREYMKAGQLPPADVDSARVAVTAGSIDIGAASAPTSIVTISYPFNFIVLQPVARLLVSGSTLGSAVTLTARAEMRNEQ